MSVVLDEYDFRLTPPDTEDYLRLRRIAGLSPFTPAVAAQGLAGTYIGVSVLMGGEVVAMGRIIGDGGLFFQVVDIAVDPAHQRKGLGRRIMASLMESLAARHTEPIYISLIADGAAAKLYAQFGFQPTTPKSIGMARWLNRE